MSSWPMAFRVLDDVSEPPEPQVASSGVQPEDIFSPVLKCRLRGSFNLFIHNFRVRKNMKILCNSCGYIFVYIMTEYFLLLFLESILNYVVCVN